MQLRLFYRTPESQENIHFTFCTVCVNMYDGYWIVSIYTSNNRSVPSFHNGSCTCQANVHIGVTDDKRISWCSHYSWNRVRFHQTELQCDILQPTGLPVPKLSYLSLSALWCYWTIHREKLWCTEVNLDQTIVVVGNITKSTSWKMVKKKLLELLLVYSFIHCNTFVVMMTCCKTC